MTTVFLAPWSDGRRGAEQAPHTILAIRNGRGHYHPAVAEIPVQSFDPHEVVDNVHRSLVGRSDYVVIGGEHTITLGVLRARGPAHLVLFDAHSDDYHDLDNRPLNCGNWLATAKNEGLVDGVTWINYRDHKQPIIPQAKHYHVSVDVDVLAPGEIGWATAYPALGGCWLSELVNDISSLALLPSDSITADLVEYVPMLDTANRVGGNAAAEILGALLSVVH